MASEDFKKLTDLIFNQQFKVIEGNTNLNPIPYQPGSFIPITTITLKKDNKEIKFESNEDDVTFFGLSFRHNLDQSGNMTLVSYKDINKYYNDFDYLRDEDGSKIAQAMDKMITWALINEDIIKKLEEKIDICELKKLINQELPVELLIHNLNALSFSPDEIREILNNTSIEKCFEFKYNVENLFNEFLLSNSRESNKFENLRQNHFEILAYFISLSQEYSHMVDGRLSVNNKPAVKFKIYSQFIQEILILAFRKTLNPIKNYLEYAKFINLDLDTHLKSKANEHIYVETSLKKLMEKGSTDIDVGTINSFLDYYKREYELASNFINSIRISLELIQDNINPDKHKETEENIRIINKFTYYSKLVKDLDAKIKNLETNINIEINVPEEKIIFRKIKEEKKIKILEYTVEEFMYKTLDLHQNLIPALITSFYIHKMSLILEILTSKEYLLLLLGIDNINTSCDIN